MASNRNVIKATKSPMGPATCCTTNMTRCVIRPAYKGDGSYSSRMWGEQKSQRKTKGEEEEKRKMREACEG